MASTSRADNSQANADGIALDASLNSTLTPCKEYLLQGSIRVEHVHKLLDVLRGLCDNLEDEMETFRDYEAAYSSFIINKEQVRLRARRSLIHQERPSALRYVGRTELGTEMDPTAVRTCVDVGVTDDVGKFVEMMRFVKDFEFVASGYTFKKGRMRITVSRIIDATEKGNLIQEHRYVSNSYLVEMSVIEQAGRSAAGVEMRQFADRLEPLVYMIKPRLN